jgi:nucleoside-diphosphate-sugar epimerase
MDNPNKKRILLTGATGNMGCHGLEELLDRDDRFQVSAFVLPTDKERQIIAPYQKRGVNVIWGDLTSYEDVLRGVSGADIVLHVGALVSPLADTLPELTMNVNVGGTKNIVQAILAQPDPDQIKLVYIGSIAQYGNRPVPIHWGRVGDPIKLSTFDTYALSKTIAERIVIESGIKNWVSLRQTGIARMATTEPIDPITFHTTLDGVLEWITPKDSGRLLANVCEDDVPEEFWGNIYNIGGGEPNRLTNLELFKKMFSVVGVEDYQQVLEPNWFALRNFHGLWFQDSTRLEEIVPYQQQTFDAFLVEQIPQIPWYSQLAGALPRLVRRKFEKVAQGPGGTLYWIVKGELDHIKAYFGSRQIWQNIRGWESIDQARPPEIAPRLDHGYDESKSRINLKDAIEAARFRGGECLSKVLDPGDWRSPLLWQCHVGHEFPASLNLILKGGHWCPVCIEDRNAYPLMAEKSPFFKQVYEPDLVLG